MGRHVDGVHIADILAAGELAHIAIEVLLRQLMESAMVTALEEAEERLLAIGRHVAPDILTGLVIDSLVPALFAEAAVGGPLSV